MRACPNGAIQPLTGSFTGFARYRYTIALPSPALYSQFRRDACCPAPSCTRPQGDRLQRRLRLRPGPEKRSASPLTSSWPTTAVPSADLAVLPGCGPPGPGPLSRPGRPTDSHGSPHGNRRPGSQNPQGARAGAEAGTQIGVIYVTPRSGQDRGGRAAAPQPASYLDGAIAISDIYQPLLAALAREPGTAGRHGGRPEGLAWGGPVLGAGKRRACGPKTRWRWRPALTWLASWRTWKTAN